MIASSGPSDESTARHPQPADGDLLVVGASPRRVGRLGERASVATARRLADGRGTELSVFQAVPEPIRVRDPWQVEAEVAAGVETARALGS